MDTTAEILCPLGATPAPAELPLFPDASCGFPSPAEAWSDLTRLPSELDSEGMSHA